MLHHVSLEVPPDQGDRSVEFWGLLGFEEVPAADVLGDSVRWLERDGTQIHLILTEGHTAPALGHAAVVELTMLIAIENERDEDVNDGELP